MSLTSVPGPLSARSAATNYTIDGPAHKILFQPVGRRIRLELDGHTVLDTQDAMLLHETAIRPRLYVPLADALEGVLSPTETQSFCPFKGDATYLTVTAPGPGGKVSVDALWQYETPVDSAPWLKGYAGVYEERFDRILDEDEEVKGVNDPFHRVDSRATSRHITVTAPDGTLVADTTRAVLVAETGLAARFYIPRADVLVPLTPSATTSVCAYKGEASYWSGAGVEDIAWSYETPLDGAQRLAGLVSFWGDDVVVHDAG
jgi:uncharacterized protein (DUF427 family)